jgi:hypothetical protein
MTKRRRGQLLETIRQQVHGKNLVIASSAVIWTIDAVVSRQDVKEVINSFKKFQLGSIVTFLFLLLGSFSFWMYGVVSC